MQAKLTFLQEDLTHLFDDRGIDATAYDSVVDFRDPITYHTSIKGYIENIQFLRRAFDPIFILHDSRITAPDAITTRWTMSMKFTLAEALPTRKYFNPTITFTGTSTYVFSPTSGKIVKHIDTWDSIRNQEFFSVEGFVDFFKQLLSTHTTPKLETPAYTVLRRARDYEVRRYEAFQVAQTPMEAAAQATSEAVNPAGPGNKAFNKLAGYIFGPGNKDGAKMAMTTPVFTDTSGAMKFVLGPSALKGRPALPAPVSADVTLACLPPATYAARLFTGRAAPEETSRQAEALRRSLDRDGLRAASSAYTLGRYNDPSTPGPFRRNEVLVELEGFDLWA